MEDPIRELARVIAASLSRARVGALAQGIRCGMITRTFVRPVVESVALSTGGLDVLQPSTMLVVVKGPCWAGSGWRKQVLVAYRWWSAHGMSG